MRKRNYALLLVAVAILLAGAYIFLKPTFNQIQQKRDGSWMPMYAMTKKQRQILKCLDLSEATVKTLVSKLRV